MLGYIYLYKVTIKRTPKRKPGSGRLQLDSPNKNLKIKVTYKKKKPNILLLLLKWVITTPNFSSEKQDYFPKLRKWDTAPDKQQELCPG